MSTYIYIIDDLVFFFVGIVILYLFVLAVASHFKRIVYPKAEKKYHCAILVPEESPLPVSIVKNLTNSSHTTICIKESILLTKNTINWSLSYQTQPFLCLHSFWRKSTMRMMPEYKPFNYTQLLKIAKVSVIVSVLYVKK